ncbi:MAG: hypothetical protein Q8P05_02940 [Candidatus Diapherotrites archaeon]|nr:hypothetical protein [Candidatus Diapherotrites archaeon]
MSEDIAKKKLFFQAPPEKLTGIAKSIQDSIDSLNNMFKPLPIFIPESPLVIQERNQWARHDEMVGILKSGSNQQNLLSYIATVAALVGSIPTVDILIEYGFITPEIGKSLIMLLSFGLIIALFLFVVYYCVLNVRSAAEKKQPESLTLKNESDKELEDQEGFVSAIAL